MTLSSVSFYTVIMSVLTLSQYIFRSVTRAVKLPVQYVSYSDYHVSMPSSLLCSPFHLSCHRGLSNHYDFHIQTPCHSYPSNSQAIYGTSTMSTMTIHYTILDFHATYDTILPDHIWSTPYHDTPFTILYMITTSLMTQFIMPPINTISSTLFSLSYHMWP